MQHFETYEGASAGSILRYYISAFCFWTGRFRPARPRGRGPAARGRRGAAAPRRASTRFPERINALKHSMDACPCAVILSDEIYLRQSLASRLTRGPARADMPGTHLTSPSLWPRPSPRAHVRSYNAPRSEGAARLAGRFAPNHPQQVSHRSIRHGPADLALLLHLA